MSLIAGLVVKIAERCNLNCSYCYMYNHVDKSYQDRPVFMSTDIFRRLVDRMAEYLDAHRLTDMGITLHGGEPMLMDPAVVEQFVDIARARLGRRVSFGLQTNATLVTDEWIRVVKAQRIAVGVSLDGPPQIHDRFRVYHDGRGSYQAALGGLDKLRSAGISPGILCVIQPGTDGLGVYRHLRSLGLTNLNFLLPAVCYDTPPTAAISSATPVADFLIPIFDEWFAEDDPDVSIRLFREILRVLLGGRSRTEAIGAGSLNYLVIDTDGSIHSNDCLKVCDAGVSASGLNVSTSSFEDVRTGLPLVYQLTFEQLPVAEACASCPELATCGGGSAPSRYSRARGFDNPSFWCRDLLKTIRHVRQAVESVAADDLHVHARSNSM
jgi:uncharacterized protein